MTIVAVDDEKLAMEGLVTAIEKAVPDTKVFGFRNAENVLSFIEENSCNIAFLDIEMRKMNGIELAKRLKLKQPDINIIFTTGYSEYTVDAFALHASGYVMKPITSEKISREIADLRHPVEHLPSKRIRVQTFGNFEVFADELPMQLQYNKSRELLAYLVDRHGALCTNNEIMAVLWEDEVRSSYLKNLRSDLFAALSKVDSEDIIVKQRGKLGIVPEKIDCDYFDWLNGDAKAINAYKGEYMSQYSWAEMTMGNIISKMDEL